MKMIYQNSKMIQRKKKRMIIYRIKKRKEKSEALPLGE